MKIGDKIIYALSQEELSRGEYNGATHLPGIIVQTFDGLQLANITIFLPLLGKTEGRASCRQDVVSDTQQIPGTFRLA